MPYSAVQMRALHAMGLVPWVQRPTLAGGPVSPALAATGQPAVAPEAATPDSSAGAAPVGVAAPGAGAGQGPDSGFASYRMPDAVAVSAPAPEPVAARVTEAAVPARTQAAARTADGPGKLVIPAESRALAGWLAQQLVLPDADREQRLQSGERPAAGLLVLFEPGDTSPDPVQAVQRPPGRTPTGLSGQSLRLFEAMLAAIDLAPRDLVLATLACGAGTEAGADAQPLAELLATPLRAVLLMEQDQGSAAQRRASDVRFEPGVPSLVGWRCPHPDVLLREPLRKRSAWQVLKAVRRLLSERTA